MKTLRLLVCGLAAACVLPACDYARHPSDSTSGSYSAPQYQGPYYGTSYYRYGPPYTSRSFYAHGPSYVGPVYYYRKVSSAPPPPAGFPQRVTTWQYTSRYPTSWGAPVVVYRSEPAPPRPRPEPRLLREAAAAGEATVFGGKKERRLEGASDQRRRVSA